MDTFRLTIRIKKMEIIHETRVIPKQISGVRQQSLVHQFPNTPSRKKTNPEIDEFIFILIRAIGIMSRVFANCPEDRGSIPSRFIPKTQKSYLMPTCLALNIIR